MMTDPAGRITQGRCRFLRHPADAAGVLFIGEADGLHRPENERGLGAEDLATLTPADLLATRRFAAGPN